MLAAEAGAADAGPPAPHRPAAWLTEVLVAELPKFVPQSNEDVESTVAAEPAVEKDGVLALPTMRVRPVMKVSPSDYGLLTPKGRLELAMKTHPGLRIGNLLGLNQGISLFMQMEEQEVRTKFTLYHRLDRVLLDDSEYARETRRMLESALGRANAGWLKNAREK
ncbi:MAG: hypothetical protein ABUL61_07175 [Oleiharenicola lentus]